MLLLSYSKCSTCTKARKWLEENHISYTLRQIAEEPPTLAELKEWYPKSGLPLKRFFNTCGQSYRSMDLKNRLLMLSEEEQLQLLASDGMLVKRPLLITENQVLVGFKEAEWDCLK